MSNDRQQTPKIYANRYKAQRSLGKGSFGQVYLVEDLRAKDKTTVYKVLKRITVGDIQPDESLDAVHEAKLMQKLQHPCIVRFYDSFLDGEFFCIVAEYCNGGDLDVLLTNLKKQGNYLEESQILTWFVELLCAVHYIHSRGVLHRDLKTRNVFIHDKMLKLGDFGISRIMLTTSDMASTFVGTPYYMSPEVLKHEGYNSKSDIWSLGCILMEMCTLQRTFDGSNIMKVMWSIMEKEIPSIPSRYDQRLQNLANRILRRNPKERPSAFDLLQLDFIAQHVRRMSSGGTELASLVASPTNSSDGNSRRDADVLRLSAKDHVTMEQLRQDERAIKLGNLNPRERRRILKQEVADQRAAELNEAARENRAKAMELKQRKLSELRGSLAAQREDEEADRMLNDIRSGVERRPTAVRVTLAHPPGERSVVESGYDSGNRRTSNDGVSNTSKLRGQRSFDKDRPAPRTSMPARIDFSSTAPSSMYKDSRMPPRGSYERHRDNEEDDVPDDPQSANTHYDAEDFDSDSDNDTFTMRANPDDETMRDFSDMLKNLHRQLQVNETNGSRPPTSVGSSEEQAVISTRSEVDAYGPIARDTKIKNMRMQAIERLGQARFDKAYAYLLKARGYGSPKRRFADEALIASELKKLIPPELYSHCFIVEQLLFLEHQ